MIRPVTLMTAQWQDMELDALCRLADELGFDGIELACGPHFDPLLAASDTEYCARILEIIDRNHLGLWTIAAHGAGYCVASRWDPRAAELAPAGRRNTMDDIQQWGTEVMTALPQASRNMGVRTVTGFLGSPIWPLWYSYPPTPPEDVAAGFDLTRDLWNPILDTFEQHDVRFAFEVHPGQIAFDTITALRVLDLFSWRPEIGINFDPSHLHWQGINCVVFLREFAERIYHVHVKDVALTPDGRSGILGSFLEPGDTRRGWNFRAPGHGDVPFEDLLRELNAIDYDGPLSVEWEDSAMDRVAGAAEACEFVRQLDFTLPRSCISM